MARLGADYPVPDFKGDWKAEMAWLQQLAETGLKQPDGRLQGCVIDFTVADGKACYYVQSEKPLVLRHIQFGDGYAIDMAHIRGLRIEDVQRQVDLDRQFRKLTK
jgi:hypothetical protein